MQKSGERPSTTCLSTTCPEETADRLMEVSTKAKQNGHDYALGQAMRAAEKVAVNPRSRSR
jgi:hypothetical protein